MDNNRMAIEAPQTENSELRERLEKELLAARAMAESRVDELGTVLDAMLDPVALYKTDGTPARVNAAMVKLLGHDPTGLGLHAYTVLLRSRGFRWLDCAPPSEGEPPCPCRRVLRGEAACSQKTFQINAADGHTLTIEANATLILSEGRANAVVAVWRDVTERRQAEDALCRSEERYHSLFNEMTEGFALHEIICDDVGAPCDYRFLDVNPAFERMTGLQWEDVVGKTQTHLLPGDDPGLIKVYGEVALTGRSIHFDNYSPTLKRYYEIFAYCPAPRQFAVLFTDITEQKIAERKIVASLKEKETLLRELSHRTKNNMNIISSLIMLQTSSLKDTKTAEMLKELQGRILTMSLVHEKLYQSNDLSAVDISEYIVGLTNAIMASYTFEAKAVTLTREIESIPFSIDDAIPCGLIINELMTNSLKYAFAERCDGKICISLQSAGKEEVVLRYTDNGVGIPEGFDMKTAKSLGMKLVYLLATKQMRGSVDLIHGNGAGFLLRLKTSSLQML